MITENKITRKHWEIRKWRSQSQLRYKTINIFCMYHAVDSGWTYSVYIDQEFLCNS